MRSFFLIGCLAPTLLTAQFSAKLQPETISAFEKYVHDAEPALALPTLRIDHIASERKRVLEGELAIDSLLGAKGRSIPGGLIHDWVGTAFIPSRSPSEVISQLKDYEHHAGLFPEVLRGKILSNAGDSLTVFLRLRKKNVLTVNLNTEYTVQLKRVGSDQLLWSHSTKIAEINDADTPHETELPVGDDRGFLWRINAYWTAHPVTGGTIVECRSISLSRDVPIGLGPIIRPFIRDLPRQSIDTMLTALKLKLSKS